MDNHKADKVEIYQDEENEWRWRAKSNNGEIVAESGEGYTGIGHCKEMATEMFPTAVVHIVSEPDPED